MVKVLVEKLVDLHDADKNKKAVKVDGLKDLGFSYLSNLKINKSERSVEINGEKYGIVTNIYGGADDSKSIFDDNPTDGQFIVVMDYSDYKKYKGYDIVRTKLFDKNNPKLTPVVSDEK